MTIESIHRIRITAMVLLLVVAAAAAQTTNTPLYVDGVHRVVATFHRINEGSPPGQRVHGKLRIQRVPVLAPGHAENANDSSKHRRGGSEDGPGKRLLKRCGPGEAYSTRQARQAKDEPGSPRTDCSSTESPVGESKKGGEIAQPGNFTVTLNPTRPFGSR
jgi:hypothetical protein